MIRGPQSSYRGRANGRESKIDSSAFLFSNRGGLLYFLVQAYSQKQEKVLSSTSYETAFSSFASRNSVFAARNVPTGCFEYTILLLFKRKPLVEQTRLAFTAHRAMEVRSQSGESLIYDQLTSPLQLRGKD